MYKSSSDTNFHDLHFSKFSSSRHKTDYNVCYLAYEFASSTDIYQYIQSTHLKFGETINGAQCHAITCWKTCNVTSKHASITIK